MAKQTNAKKSQKAPQTGIQPGLDLNWVYAPGEDFHMTMCPPYCTTKLFQPTKPGRWMKAACKMEILEIPLGTKEDEALVRQWVVQLVRQRLGSSLEEAEREQRTHLGWENHEITLDPTALKLIVDALKRRSKDCPCGC